MASHHHTYHPCHHPIPTSTTSSSCYCCHYTSYTPSHHPPAPDSHPPSSALHLHLHHPPPPPPPPHPQPHLFPPYAPQTHQHHPSPPPPQNPHHFQEPHHHQHQKEELTQPIISSLLHRISALEASLKRYSLSSSSFNTLRDAAARTIQTHFRAFLVHRSRTLWQLKELASIKSTLIALKSSVSENTHFDSRSLSRKAVVLLRKLDSIQSGDPMIRDGKRSITRELNRLMEFIDSVSVKRNEISSRVAKNVKRGENSNKFRDLSIEKKRVNVKSVKLGRRVDEMEKLRERIEKINSISEEDVEEDEELDSPALSLVRRSGILINRSGGLTKENSGARAKEKRSVRFAEDGNVCRVFRSRHGSLSNGDCNSVEGSDSGDAEGELIANLGRDVEEIMFSSKEKENDDEDGQSEDEEGSPESSDGEKDSNYNLKFRDDIVMNSHDQGEDGDFVFSAPLPLKMESRADLMNKRKSVKL